MRYPQQSEVETEGSEVQGYPQLQEVSLGYYMGPFSKIKKSSHQVHKNCASHSNACLQSQLLKRLKHRISLVR